jgi:hypothetical protein
MLPRDYRHVEKNVKFIMSKRCEVKISVGQIFGIFGYPTHILGHISPLLSFGYHFG